jgi:uncharacterized protein (AIM24 family)
MVDTSTEYNCPYCRSSSSGAGATCPSCGAPVDVTRRTTTSGWTELPAIPDMTRIQMGQSSAQILGKLVPAVDVRLAVDEGVYFPQHNLLWQEPAVAVTAMSLRSGWDRMRAGLPVIMLEAAGPGTISFSHDAAGEVLALPLQPGAAVDVREHSLVVATRGVGYDWYDTGVWFTTSGNDSATEAGGVGLLKAGLNLAGLDTDDNNRRSDETEWHYPLGRYLDRFSAGDRPGVVFVQCGGNAFVRDLAEGEQILVKPPALLFKDPSVGYQLHVEYPGAGMQLWRTWGNRYMWLRVWGPGRVGLQSSYERLDDPGTDFRDSCQYTQRLWT